MTRNRSRLQQVLSEKQMTTTELAKNIGLSVRSIHNVSCGSSKSRAARHRIQQSLQVQVWDDVPFICASHVRFEAGTIFVFPALEFAKRFADEIGDAGERRGSHVRLATDIDWAFEIDGNASPARPSEKESAGGAAGAIEIWTGDVPPDSPFAALPPEEASSR